MIGVRLHGRLGNQLFQYAFALATAKKLGVKFYIDKAIEPYLLPYYFEVNTDYLQPLDRYVFSIKGYKNIFSSCLRKLWHKILVSIRRLKVVTFDENLNFDLQQHLIADRILYRGFFQSEDYFKTAIPEVNRHFTIKKKYQDQFQTIWSTFKGTKKTVVVHVRRTDYVGINLCLPMSYYHELLEDYTNEQYQLIFISDDPEFVAQEFGHIADKYISKNSMIIDLQFLIHADICLLANSTFSWWGAYLNCKGAKVFSPKYWSGFAAGVEEPIGINLKKWILKQV